MFSCRRQINVVRMVSCANTTTRCCIERVSSSATCRFGHKRRRFASGLIWRRAVRDRCRAVEYYIVDILIPRQCFPMKSSSWYRYPSLLLKSPAIYKSAIEQYRDERRASLEINSSLSALLMLTHCDVGPRHRHQGVASQAQLNHRGSF